MPVQPIHKAQEKESGLSNQKGDFRRRPARFVQRLLPHFQRRNQIAVMVVFETELRPNLLDDGQRQLILQLQDIIKITLVGLSRTSFWR